MKLERSAVAAALAYVLLLVVGSVVLLPVAITAAVWLFRSLFRDGRVLAPFVITLVAFAVQNIAAGALGEHHAVASLRLAITLSALLPAAVLAGGWWSAPALARRWLRRDLSGDQLLVVLVAFASVAVTLARWLTSPVTLGLALPSARNALAPAYGVLVALLLPESLRPRVDDVGRWLARWGVVVAALGFVDLLVLRDRFWADVAHIGAAISVKRLSLAHVRGYHVPADFYTAIGHHYFRRLVSIYGDAITTSYYLALAALAAALLSRGRFRAVQLALIMPALALGAVKGAFGVIVVGAILAAGMATRLRPVLASGAVVVLLACTGCIAVTYATRFVPLASSVELHVGGLASAVRHTTSPLDTSILWGDGMGTGGSGAVYVRRASTRAHVSARGVPGVDNGAGTILVESGILGLALMLGQFALVAGACLRRARESRGALLAGVAAGALLSNFLLQEHALTLATGLPFWLLAATAIRTRTRTSGAALASTERDGELPTVDGAGHVDDGPQRPVEQVVDDPELLELMVSDSAEADGRDASAVGAAPVALLVEELRKGLRDFRRRDDVPPLGGTERVTPDAQTLRDELSNVDLEIALFVCRLQAGRLPNLVPVEKLDVSRAGDPFGREDEGRFLTPEALVCYMRCAYVAEFVDLSEIDLLVELGAGRGEQAEVLHALYPNLTIVLIDTAPQLYFAERFLTTALPGVTVPYRETRGRGPVSLERGKIYFLPTSRIGDVTGVACSLFWHAAGFDETDADAVEHYGPFLAEMADSLYINQRFEKNDWSATHQRRWQRHEQMLQAYKMVDCRPSHSAFMSRRAGGRRSEDTFWTRRFPARDRGDAACQDRSHAV